MSRIFILATGSSINEFTKEDWEFLRKEKTMGISWFFKKNFETDFYYSHEYDTQPLKIAEHITKNKWNTKLILGTQEYFNKSFIHPIKKPLECFERYKNVIQCQQCMITNFLNSWANKPWKLTEDSPPMPFPFVWAKSFNQPLFGFRGTLIASINAASVLGFDEIVLCGVDLNNGLHFYESGKSHFEKNFIKDYNPNLHPHSSQLIFQGHRGVLDGLKWINKHIKLKTFTKNENLLSRNGFEIFKENT